jgi:hypothetical protein
MITNGTFNSRVLGAFALAAGAALLASSVAGAATLRRSSTTSASAATGPDPSTMISAYYDVDSSAEYNGSGHGDNLVRLANSTAANGSVCAFIYVFDNDEEMGACCGCPVSPNGLDQISVEDDFLSNVGITSYDFYSGLIQITTGLPNSATFVSSLGLSVPTCDPGQASTAVGNLEGWITHNQDIQGTTSLTEVPFWDQGAADSSEASYLVSTCHFLETNGTGTGLCYCGDVDYGNALPFPPEQAN